jgi:pimeloyl-ACP methyl ester carboxylesterase
MATAAEEPLYFPSEKRTLFGWLSRPGNLSGDRGVLICKPFGYEAICAHRILTTFARTTASVGFPTLRFDYLGTGDSAEIDDRADQIETWCQNVVTAIEELRRRTGVERVCLLGFRLGALLATLAAMRSSAVDSLILVAPVVSGRRHLGELRVLVASSMLYSTTGGGGSSDETPEPGSMEVCGHRVSALTISALSRIDLATQAPPPVSRMLVLDRDDVPAARPWVQALSEMEMPIEYAALPGFPQMMMVAPHESRVPHATIAAARHWLLRFPRQQFSSPATAKRTADLQPDALQALPSSLSLVASKPGSSVALNEHAVRFGPSRMLFGIVTEPCSGGIRRAVVLLNAGADVHVAFGRMYVTLARRWAELGFVVLRMDLAGLGDSETRPGRPDNDVFPAAALDDVREALDFLRERYGLRDVTVGGLCAAAYHALRAAAAGLPLSGILMVNPLNFYWKQGTPISDLQPADIVRDWDTHRERWSSRAAWKKFLSGKVSTARVNRVAQVVAHRVRIAAASAAREVARYLRIPMPQDLGRELAKIAERGVQIDFVFARGEPGIELLKLHAGSALRRLGTRCRVHIIETADHNFTCSGPRSMLESVLTEALLAPQ